MASLVKPADAALRPCEFVAGDSFQLVQLSRAIQLPCLGLSRRPRRCEAWVWKAKASANGRPLHRTAKRGPFRRAALPEDPGRVKPGSESGPSDANAEPWLGAVIFKRSAVRTHYEFRTSLERLGMGFLSTESSRALANSMGLYASIVDPATEEFTPVQISIDVEREEREERTKNLHLDGIARTSVCLCCNRCLSPVVERLFASFSLLLSEKPIMEPTQQRIGVVLGSGQDHDGPVLDLELDDKLHFPKDAREIDLSKYLRDTVHLEIPLRSLCSVHCLGLCLTCGKNLNNETCNCKDEGDSPIEVQNESKKSSWGALDQLKTQLEAESQGDGEDELQ